MDSNAAANAVNENVSIGTLVGVTASASDADATTNGVTYALTSNPGGLFAINTTTGVVTTAAAIDREAIAATTNIQVTATSADGSTAAQTFSIAINDQNDTVTLTTGTDVVSFVGQTNIVNGTIGTGATLNTTDSLTGGSGTDTLVISGNSGTFN